MKAIDVVASDLARAYVAWRNAQEAVRRQIAAPRRARRPMTDREREQLARLRVEREAACAALAVAEEAFRTLTEIPT